MISICHAEWTFNLHFIPKKYITLKFKNCMSNGIFLVLRKCRKKQPFLTFMVVNIELIYHFICGNELHPSPRVEPRVVDPGCPFSLNPDPVFWECRIGSSFSSLSDLDPSFLVGRIWIRLFFTVGSESGVFFNWGSDPDLLYGQIWIRCFLSVGFGSSSSSRSDLDPSYLVGRIWIRVILSVGSESGVFFFVTRI